MTIELPTTLAPKSPTFHETWVKLDFMKSATPALLPLLRSRAQGDVIAWIMLHPDQAFSVKEVADKTGVSHPTASREIDRLAEAGLITEQRVGNLRLVQAATDNPVFAPLAALMTATFGPLPVLSDLLRGAQGIREAHIYGSWAARYAGRPGAVPDDIDVLVIGTMDLDLLDDIASRAGERLGREVNIRRVRPQAWDEGNDPFKQTVLGRPMVELVGRVSDE